MKWIYRFDRKYGRKFGLPNLMLYVGATMIAVYMISWLVMQSLPLYIAFVRPWIMQGEVWRLITFLFMPPAESNLFFLFIAVYFAYYIGSALEESWGTCLFTLYYLLGWIGAIVAGFITGIGTNSYMNLSILLAFAYLFPNQEFLLFFVLPVKAKWFGLAYAALILYSFIMGTVVDRVAIAFSLLNFLVFFGPQLYRKIREGYKYQKTRDAYRKQWNDNNPWR